MDLITPLKIDVFYKGAKECELEELGIALSKGVPEEKEEVTIYSVDYCSKASYEEDGPQYGTVSSGGQEFITSHSYKELLSMIEKASSPYGRNSLG